VTAPEAPRQSVRAQRFEPSAERWTPHRWTSELGPALVIAMRDALGTRGGGRAAHRDGVVWTGRFTPSGAAAGLSDFAGFRGAEVPVVARFSNLRTRRGERDIRGMATKLLPLDGEMTDLVAMSLEVFPVRRARDFLALLEAAREAAHKGRVRGALAVLGLIVTLRVSLPALVRGIIALASRRDPMDTTYHGVQTFRLVRDRAPGMAPDRRPMRYRWVPIGDDARRGKAARASARDETRFALELVLGDPGWRRLDDPTWAWPKDAPTVRAGELVLDRIIEPEPEDLAFNPLLLAPGIEPGPDDIFSDRAGAYAVAHASHAQGRAPAASAP
jgi:catalase